MDNGPPGIISDFRGPRGAAEKAVDGSSAPTRPISGFSDCAARSRMHDALAALLVASPGSGPPGSPNLSSRFSAAPLEDDPVDVRLAELEPHPWIKPVGFRAIDAGLQLHHLNPFLAGELQACLHQRRADALAASGLIHHHLVEARLD